MSENFKILKKPPFSFLNLRISLINTKRPQIDQQVKKCKKTKNKIKTPNHREDSSLGTVTEVIKRLTEDFFSYNLTFGQKSHGDIWRAFQVFKDS